MIIVTANVIALSETYSLRWFHFCRKSVCHLPASLSPMPVVVGFDWFENPTKGKSPRVESGNKTRARLHLNPCRPCSWGKGLPRAYHRSVLFGACRETPSHTSLSQSNFRRPHTLRPPWIHPLCLLCHRLCLSVGGALLRERLLWESTHPRVPLGVPGVRQHHRPVSDLPLQV
jgi:hypothetical protein